MPLRFEANHGQADASVQFLAHAQGYSVALTATEARLILQPPTGSAPADAAETRAAPAAALAMRLVGANAAAQGLGLDRLPGVVNYYLGNDPAQWHTNIPTYARVEFRDVYPDIDLVYYGNQQQLEYDFVVAPGANPQSIKLAFPGADPVAVNAQGDLVLHGAGGDVRQQSPFLYQEVNGVKQPIGGAYALQGQHQVGFQVSAYDAQKPLVIDPVIVYSTYAGSPVLGPPGPFSSQSVAVDSSGNVYLTGTTSSAVGAPSAAFVLEADPTLSTVLFTTFLGGPPPSISTGYGIAVDPAGFVYVAGTTTSPAFPIIGVVFQPAFGGPTSDGFVTELAPGLVPVLSSYLCGPPFGPFPHAGYGVAFDPSTGFTYVTGTTNTGTGPPGPSSALVAQVAPGFGTAVYALLGGPAPSISIGYGTAVDGPGNVYLTGVTTSPSFPITPGVFQPSFGGPLSDGFVAELSFVTGGLMYSSYLCGPGFGPLPHAGYGLAVGGGGDAFVTGTTNTGAGPPGPSAVVVVHVAPGGGSLLYGVLLGGFPPSVSAGFGIAVDPAGFAYVTGGTTSATFPLVAPFIAAFSPPSDAIVAEFDPLGAIVYSSYLGGPGSDVGAGIAVAPGGGVYVTGTTTSPAFPTTPGTFMPAYTGDPSDGFVTYIA
jgi:hypothetical protein